MNAPIVYFLEINKFLFLNQCKITMAKRKAISFSFRLFSFAISSFNAQFRSPDAAE